MTRAHREAGVLARGPVLGLALLVAAALGCERAPRDGSRQPSRGRRAAAAHQPRPCDEGELSWPALFGPAEDEDEQARPRSIRLTQVGSGTTYTWILGDKTIARLTLEIPREGQPEPCAGFPWADP